MAVCGRVNTFFYDRDTGNHGVRLCPSRSPIEFDAGLGLRALGMTLRSPFSLTLHGGGCAAGTLVGPDDGFPGPPILFLREDSLGEGGFFYPTLVERLAANGFVTATLDRAGEDAIDPANELVSAKAFVDAAASGGLDGRVARGKVGIAGHGLGGGLALLVAASNANVVGAVALGCSAELDRGDDLPRRSFAEEVRRHPERYSIEHAVRGYPGRLVFIHGEEDQRVPIEEAERLYHWANKDRSRLIVMEKVGHSFGAQDPFVGLTKEVDRIGKVLVDFFHSLLG
jgi:dienelactone hydrolase